MLKYCLGELFLEDSGNQLQNSPQIASSGMLWRDSLTTSTVSLVIDLKPRQVRPG